MLIYWKKFKYHKGKNKTFIFTNKEVGVEGRAEKIVCSRLINRTE